MEFQQAIKNLNKMCSSYYGKHNCRCCPLESYGYNGKTGCFTFISNHPEKAEELVTKWTEENPTKTNLDELTRMIKKFCGNAVIVQPQVFFPGISVEPPEESADRFENWLYEEYKEEV